MENCIRILLVSPMRDYLTLLRDALSAEPDLLISGVCSGGSEAYRWLQENRVDLLLTDLLLPELDGLSLLRRLKDEGILPHTVVLSGFYNDRMAQAVSTLADNYLPKPVSAAVLAGCIREAVLGRGCAFDRSYAPLVRRLLMDCGVPPHLHGFDYLASGIVRALEDRSALRGVTKCLYRDIAREYSTTAACVERSMRSALDRAWNLRTPAQRREAFGSLFDLCPVPPSNVMFLTMMTEYVEDLYESGRGFA